MTCHQTVLQKDLLIAFRNAGSSVLCGIPRCEIISGLMPFGTPVLTLAIAAIAPPVLGAAARSFLAVK
jgi:hypothetical protein